MATWTRCYRCGRKFQPPFFPNYFWKATCENCLVQLEQQSESAKQARAAQWKKNADFWGKIFYYFIFLPVKLFYKVFVWLIMSIYGNVALGVIEIVGFGVSLFEGRPFGQIYGLLIFGLVMIAIGAVRYLHGSKEPE